MTNRKRNSMLSGRRFTIKIERNILSETVGTTSKVSHVNSTTDQGPFHKSSYERFSLYEFVEPVLNYRCNEFVALTNLCETVPWQGSG